RRWVEPISSVSVRPWNSRPTSIPCAAAASANRWIRPTSRARSPAGTSEEPVRPAQTRTREAPSARAESSTASPSARVRSSSSPSKRREEPREATASPACSVSSRARAAVATSPGGTWASPAHSMHSRPAAAAWPTTAPTSRSRKVTEQRPGLITEGPPSGDGGPERAAATTESDCPPSLSVARACVPPLRLRTSRREGEGDRAPAQAGGVHGDLETSSHPGDAHPVRLVRTQVRGPREMEGDSVLTVGRVRDAELARPRGAAQQHAGRALCRDVLHPPRRPEVHREEPARPDRLGHLVVADDLRPGIRGGATGGLLVGARQHGVGVRGVLRGVHGLEGRVVPPEDLLAPCRVV